jgi:hypothetical protein
MKLRGEIRRLVLPLLAGAVVSGSYAVPVFAQDRGGEDIQKLEAVEVTGSRIKKAEVEGQTPVLTITSKDIEATGLGSIGDVIQRLSVSGSSLNTKFNSAGNFGFPPDGGGVGSGSTTISLRNLGAKRTLILVDGLRWVNESSASGVSAAVDLNTIPSSIVDRIEILTDGASSLYGSDAIAGVVNIITKKKTDGLSLHAYYGNTQPLTGNNIGRYLAMNLDMDRQIREIAAVCDYVQGLRRSNKRLWLSFDEWNVWYRARSGDAVNGRRQFAPKLLEEVYNLEDALLVGGFVNTLLRNAERVRVACLAQLVNVIAPLVTNDTGVLRQSTWFPYAWALRYARGRVLDLRVESDMYPITAAGLQADFARNDQVPFVDVVATLDSQNGQACVLMLNRDLDGERELALEWRDITPSRVLACETLTGPDLKAFNTFEQPRRVAPQRLDSPAAGARMTFKLPARSYTVAQLAITT